MGWNSWNHFADRVSDPDVRSVARALVSSGMRDAGYIYVNIDDSWQGERDAAGVLHANQRFPDMKGLADYLHANGLRFGIYSSPGSRTCAGYEGSFGHESQDAQMYAAWGVDFLKYDLCTFRTNMKAARAGHHGNPNASRDLMMAAYRKMKEALNSTGRPIVYSLSQHGIDRPWTWGPQLGANMWRTTDDVEDSYVVMSKIGFGQAGLAKFAGPGHWNDPDMLEIGNGGMTEDEYKTHMSLWALLAAPLLAGNDVANMTDTAKRILMNKDAIAIDQDSLGVQGDLVLRKGKTEVWRRPLSGTRTAVGLFNRGTTSAEIIVDLRAIGFPDGADIRDVWKAADLGRHSGVFRDTVATHGVTLLIVDGGVRKAGITGSGIAALSKTSTRELQ